MRTCVEHNSKINCSLAIGSCKEQIISVYNSAKAQAMHNKHNLKIVNMAAKTFTKTPYAFTRIQTSPAV